jgi:CMP-N-acetylneuraminic acid synthetase
MKIALQIPIKGKSSTRVPNKNFRQLNGKPLCYWLLDELLKHAPSTWDIHIDSEDSRTMDKLSPDHRRRFRFFQRNPWYAGDNSNGNHLINQFAVSHPNYDIFAQIYITAVTLPGNIITESIQEFVHSRDRYDSMFLATKETGWFWQNDTPLNYDPHRPDGLPRSQDATLMKETKALYSVTRDAVLRTSCRIGNRPLAYIIPNAYSLDIDSMEDFHEAERILEHQ